MQAIYFDMDGTIYDLYSVTDWESRLNSEDVTAYSCGNAMYDMANLNALLEKFVALGFVIGVVTWSAMHGSKEFNKATRKVKKDWIAKNLPCVTEFHCVKYGTPKHQTARIKDSILVDDNAQVRAAWHGETINACEDIVEQLQILLDRVA